MNKKQELCNNIKKLSINIEQIIYLADIKGKEYVKEYKLIDIQNIDKLLRKCDRCGEYFLPNPNYKKWQKYCDIHCRNLSTKEKRTEIKLDKRQRPIDLLRKSIYEREYRARRENIEIDTEAFSLLLKKLTVLVKQRWNISENEYNRKMTELQEEYDTIVQRGKGDK